MTRIAAVLATDRSMYKTAIFRFDAASFRDMPRRCGLCLALVSERSIH